MDVTVINMREVQDYIRGIPAESFNAMKTEVARSLLEADEAIKNNTGLKTRSGQLFASIRTQVSGTSIDNFNASIYTDSVYAPTHSKEDGFTISAKNKYMGVPGGPYLNIPLDANKTPSGVTRLKAREVFNQGGYIRGIDNGKYGVFLGEQMMFVLQKEVTIPKRLYMVEETENVVPTMLSRIANRMIDE